MNTRVEKVWHAIGDLDDALLLEAEFFAKPAVLPWKTLLAGVACLALVVGVFRISLPFVTKCESAMDSAAAPSAPMEQAESSPAPEAAEESATEAPKESMDYAVTEDTAPENETPSNTGKGQEIVQIYALSAPSGIPEGVLVSRELTITPPEDNRVAYTDTYQFANTTDADVWCTIAYPINATVTIDDMVFLAQVDVLSDEVAQQDVLVLAGENLEIILQGQAEMMVDGNGATLTIDSPLSCASETVHADWAQRAIGANSQIVLTVGS